MIEDFDSQSESVQSDNLSMVEIPPFPSKESFTSPKITAPSTTSPVTTSKPPASHLKLVVSKTPKKAPKAPVSSLKQVASTIITAVYKSISSQQHYFTAEIRKHSPYNFVMGARDLFHCLTCELPMKVEESENILSLICQFPTIPDDELVEFIEGDEDLLVIVLVSFHMQILKTLFLFCDVQKAQNLILHTTEEQFKGLGIYQGFIKYVDKVPTKEGIKLEITIPVHSNSLTTCNELIDDMTQQFRKTLWKEQRTNSAIRDYLKANVRFSIVS